MVPTHFKRDHARRHFQGAYIGVELPDKAGEVVVLEVIGKEVPCKLRGPPDHKGGLIFTPGDNVVCARVINDLVCLGEERSRHWSVRHHRGRHLSTPLHQEGHGNTSKKRKPVPAGSAMHFWISLSLTLIYT